MSTIKFSIFDVFAYLIPGSIILIAIFILISPIPSNISELTQQLEILNLSTSFILAILSYVIGFSTDSIASFLYYQTICRFLGSPLPSIEGNLSLSQQRALVREFSPANSQFVHNWKVLKTMSHNLSLSLLILILPTLKVVLQLDPAYQAQYFLITLVWLLLSAILMHRAYIFDTWHYQDLMTVVEALHLEKKALIAATIQN